MATKNVKYLGAALTKGKTCVVKTSSLLKKKLKRISEDAHLLACRINIGKIPILPTAIYKSTDSVQFPSKFQQILVLERTILNII